MTFDQRRLILNFFMTSHSSYFQIVWIFHCRKINERMNHINERALRIIYKDLNSPFQKLFKVGNSFNTHHKNLQKRLNEIFKVKTVLSPELKNDIFEFIEKPNSPRATSHFRSGKIHTAKFGIETPCYLGPKLWNLQSFTKYLRLTLVFIQKSTLQEKFIFHF